MICLMTLAAATNPRLARVCVSVACTIVGAVAAVGSDPVIARNAAAAAAPDAAITPAPPPQPPSGPWAAV